MFDVTGVSVVADGVLSETAIDGPGSFRCGDIELAIGERGDSIEWSIAAGLRGPVSVKSAAIRFNLGVAKAPVRLFTNGYQSWSRAGRAVLGQAQDPSRAEGSIELARAVNHADAEVAAEGEIRSEMVTVVDTGGGDLVCLGFEAAREHDSTFRFRRAEGGIEVAAEAFLGGAVLQPGEVRSLHPLRVRRGPSHAELLEDWAAWCGAANEARTSAEFQVGWCSWYQYFHAVSEKDLRANLTAAGDWPFETFQLDDGYQADIGDWLVTNDKFDSKLADLSAEISRAGFRPGIWIAPFLAGPASVLAQTHPELLAGSPDPGFSLVGMVNPGWGGITFALDTTRDETIEHLENLARTLVDAGFTYIKLDFTYAPSIGGRFADPSRTPAERVRSGLEAIRRGAGEDAFLLGCGCPLGQGIGVVDGMRIGPDVAPYWSPDEGGFIPPGYAAEAPATVNAFRNTLARSFMHRRLWLNDPDCLMLRTADTQLSPSALRAWSLAVAVSGGMALLSDDLSLLGRAERALFDEVVAIGREVDAIAIEGRSPRCSDLLESETPARLEAGRFTLKAALDAGAARLDVA